MSRLLDLKNPPESKYFSCCWPWLDFLKPIPQVVLCHGCFDPFHYGHLLHFNEARRHGDILVVTVTADRFVAKGKNRPEFNEGERAAVLLALRCVDFVAINEWETAVEAIKLLRPAVYVKGEEYRYAPTERLLAERNAVESVGGRIEFAGFPVCSSTNVIQDAREVLRSKESL